MIKGTDNIHEALEKIALGKGPVRIPRWHKRSRATDPSFRSGRGKKPAGHGSTPEARRSLVGEPANYTQATMRGRSSEAGWRRYRNPSPGFRSLRAEVTRVPHE